MSTTNDTPTNDTPTKDTTTGAKLFQQLILVLTITGAAVNIGFWAQSFCAFSAVLCGGFFLVILIDYAKER